MPPSPEVGDRKTSTRGLEKTKSAVLTDTPEKDALEAIIVFRRKGKKKQVFVQYVLRVIKKANQWKNGSRAVTANYGQMKIAQMVVFHIFLTIVNPRVIIKEKI